jgi:hypothetical protein
MVLIRAVPFRTGRVCRQLSPRVLQGTRVVCRRFLFRSRLFRQPGHATRCEAYGYGGLHPKKEENEDDAII